MFSSDLPSFILESHSVRSISKEFNAAESLSGNRRSYVPHKILIENDVKFPLSTYFDEVFEEILKLPVLKFLGLLSCDSLAVTLRGAAAPSSYSSVLYMDLPECCCERHKILNGDDENISILFRNFPALCASWRVYRNWLHEVRLGVTLEKQCVILVENMDAVSNSVLECNQEIDPSSRSPLSLPNALQLLFEFITCEKCLDSCSLKSDHFPTLIVGSAVNCHLITPNFTFPRLPQSWQFLKSRLTSPLVYYPDDITQSSFGQFVFDSLFRLEYVTKTSKLVNEVACLEMSPSTGSNPISFEAAASQLDWGEFKGFAALKSELLTRVLMPLFAHSGEREAQLVALGVPVSSHQALSAALPTGILLTGPPGSGKSSLAASIAAAAGMSFISVNCSQLLSKFVGETERRLRELFTNARSRALGPVVLLLDNIDAVAPRRSFVTPVVPMPPNKEPLGADATVEDRFRKEAATFASAAAATRSGQPQVFERVLATLLNELDGLQLLDSEESSANAPFNGDTSSFPQKGWNDLLLVVGVAASARALDPALTRHGRLSTIFEVPPPSPQDAREILEGSLRSVGVELRHSVGDTLLETVSSLLCGAGASAATVSAVGPAAVLRALDDGEVLEMQHFLDALKELDVRV